MDLELAGGNGNGLKQPPRFLNENELRGSSPPFCAEYLNPPYILRETLINTSDNIRTSPLIVLSARELRWKSEGSWIYSDYNSILEAIISSELYWYFHEVK